MRGGGGGGGGGVRLSEAIPGTYQSGIPQQSTWLDSGQASAPVGLQDCRLSDIPTSIFKLEGISGTLEMLMFW